MHLTEDPNIDEKNKYILLGTSEPETEIDPNELILVQEIECPEYLQNDLYKMITCHVIIPKLNSINDINLKCSICSSLFTDLAQLTKHKMMYKICDNNLTMPTYKTSIIDGKLNESERHKYFKSQLNSFYY